MKDHVFIKRWKKDMRNTLKTAYPNISKKEINEFLDKEIEKYIKNPTCRIENNYLGKKIESNLLEIVDWIDRTKPICAGHGVFFRDQHTVGNALAQMILKFLRSRKLFKSKLADYDPASYEYATFDRKQLSEKINVNSIYGAFGNTTSFIFNKFTAPAVTGTGQSLISTTEIAFEMFMANNALFNNLDECMTFLNNVKNEECTHDASFLIDVSIDDVCSRLMEMFYKKKDNYLNIVYEYLEMLSQEELNRIYYKNNLYEFSKHDKINKLLTNIIRGTNEFKNPNKVPESIKGYLEDLWSYYKEFVFYNHIPINRIQRLKNDKRKCVITIDTDSNMLNLDPWMQFMFNDIIAPDSFNNGRDKMELKFISINTMACIITNMIGTVLEKYTSTSNVPVDYRGYINMKNEFYMPRMILTNKKKKYMSTIRLREGNEIYPEKIDLKGMEFLKSSATEETRERFKSFIKKRILHTDNVQITELLQDMQKFEDEVVNSLNSGEKTYIIPKSVKELEAYKEPFREQGIRAVHAWNSIYPDKAINLPAKIDIVKLNLDNPDNLERLARVDKVVYDRVMEKIINNPNEKISSKGLNVLAIPKNVEKVPEWALSFIATDTITYGVLKKFYPVLVSLGFKIPKTSSEEYFSNIIDI